MNGVYHKISVLYRNFASYLRVRARRCVREQEFLDLGGNWRDKNEDFASAENAELKEREDDCLMWKAVK